MTLEELVDRAGIPCLVEHEDGLRYQVLGVDPFRTSYFFCRRVSGMRPIERGGEAYLWRYARGFRLVEARYISPEDQRNNRQKDRLDRNAKQTRELKRGSPVPTPRKSGEMGKVIPFRKKEEK